MLRPSKLMEKLEDLIEKKCGPWYGDSFICEDKYPRKAGIPVTGKEDSLRLPSQGSNGDLFYSLAVSGRSKQTKPIQS